MDNLVTEFYFGLLFTWNCTHIILSCLFIDYAHVTHSCLGLPHENCYFSYRYRCYLTQVALYESLTRHYRNINIVLVSLENRSIKKNILYDMREGLAA